MTYTTWQTREKLWAIERHGVNKVLALFPTKKEALAEIDRLEGNESR